MTKQVDKVWCMSSFLTFRYVADENKIFKEGVEHVYKNLEEKQVTLCSNAQDVDNAIKKQLENIDLTDACLLLSGGIDSGILASYMPKGTVAYTARCVAPRAIDETDKAAEICAINQLKHIIVDITWNDYLQYADELMLHDGCPIFANEPQVYVLAKKIRKNGHKIVILGDNADMAFGGMDKLLSKDWTYQEWIERYTFVEPSKVLKNAADVESVYSNYKVGKNGIDVERFLLEVFAQSSSGAYINAFDYAGISYFDPYAVLGMKDKLDLKRVRAGESKYLLRELYKLKYPGLDVPEKIAMARAMDQWLAHWDGPKRPEFLRDCIEGMTGEQKFLIYSLERFLNLLDECGEIKK